MNDSRIASRYARALYILALAEGKEEAVKGDLDQLAGLLDTSPEFRMMLESPVLRGSQKAGLIQELFSGKVENQTLRFLDLLIDHKRESFLASVCRMYARLFKADQGVMEAKVESAHEWDEDLIRQLKAKLEQTTRNRIDLSAVVNSDLIGGFRLTVEDQQLDASVVSQLKKIKSELKEIKN